jgi:chromosomal replication initiation ATPase DnaA
MNHSIDVITRFVCQYYGVNEDTLKSPCRNAELVKARKMVLLLAGFGRDRSVAKYLNQSRCTQVNNRKSFYGNMQFDKNLRNEFEMLKKGLLKYEIS